MPPNPPPRAPKVFIAPPSAKWKPALGLIILSPLLVFFGMSIEKAFQMKALPLGFVIFFIFGGLFFLFLILLYLFEQWLVLKYANLKFELSDIGIAQTGPGGRIFIAWEDLENARETGVPVGILLRTKSGDGFKIPRLIQGYEILRAEIFERCHKSEAPKRPDREVFPIPAWVTWLFGSLILVCSGAVLGLTGAILNEYGTAKGWADRKLWIYLGLLLAYGAGLWFLLKYVPKIIGSRIETDEEGIRRFDRKGNEVHIPWAWIRKVTYGAEMGQLGVFGRTEDQKIMADLQLKGFEKLKTLILSKYESTFQAPAFPVFYRNGSWVLFAVIFFLGLGMAGFMVWNAFFMSDPDPGRGLFLKLGSLMAAGMILYLPWEEYHRVREVRIDQEGVHLGRRSGSHSTPWEEMEWVHWNPEEGKKMALTIGCRGGKVLEVPLGSNDILEAYLIFKGRLGAKPR